MLVNPAQLPIRAPEEYNAAKPFPHIVIDNFLPGHLAEAARSCVLEHNGVADWEASKNPEQHGKNWQSDYNKIASPVRDLLLWFNSGTFLFYLQYLTQISDLIPDMTYVGGGVHRTGRGGKLGVHCDFNFHRELKLHRRLNALYFLNRYWQPEWRGQLELWSADMKECVQKIEPSFNRLVVFSTTDTSFHGLPDPLECPKNIYRYSLALYYYTIDRPDHEKSSPHWALWQKPGVPPKDKAAQRADKLASKQKKGEV